MKYNSVRDPEILAQTLPARRSKKLILGLDLGTSTGYCCAYHHPGDPVFVGRFSDTVMVFGQLELQALSYESGAIRFVRLRQFLEVIKPDLVVYESVKYDPPGITKINAHAVLARVATAAELLGAYKATVCTWAEEHNTPCTGFAISKIKKRATGKGNASKEDISQATNATFGTELEIESYESRGTDNVADSVWVCVLGLEEYGNGLVPENCNSQEL